MNTKELLLELKKKLRKEEQSIKPSIDFSKYDINLKRNDFFSWLRKSELKINEVDIRNFIEKMAVWYEIRYPNKNIYNMFYMGKSNIANPITSSSGYGNLLSVLNEEEKNDFSRAVGLIDWNDFFDINTFIRILDDNERTYIEKPIFGFCYKFLNNQRIYFSSKGKIIEIEGNPPKYSLDLKIILDPFIGEFASSITKTLFDNGFYDDGLNIWDLIHTYEKEVLFREKLLDMVMYRIIERGHLLGVERGFLFAREFERDISIPFKYLTYSLLNKRPLINEYLKAGGSLDVDCCLYYFASKIENVEMKLEDVYHLTDKSITKEELLLRKRLIEILKEKQKNDEENEKRKVLQQRTEYLREKMMR